MDWRGRRVLLTGHTGFKGAWLALWLRELGAEVHGFSLPPPSDPSLYDVAGVGDVMASNTIGDVRDEAAVRDAFARAQPEIVLHLAAQAIVRRSFVDPAETLAVNVVGTAQVLTASRDARVVVCVTSDKCYRDVALGRPMREDDPLGGRDPYSASKAAQELVTASLRDTLLAEAGVAVATARAGNVIGGGDWAADRLVPDLFRAALAGEPLLIRNPDAVRPWQHVLNPLSGYIALAERLWDSGPGGGFDTGWNFGPEPGDEQRVSWVVERLRERWPQDITVEVRADSAADKESPMLRLDSARANQQLCWTPNLDLRAGLDATVEWFSAYARGEDMREATAAQIRRFGG
jgi:CDP-glucose 4,6-dehydratase